MKMSIKVTKMLLAIACCLLLFSNAALATDTKEADKTEAQIAADLANPLSPVTTFAASFRAGFNVGPDNDTNYQIRLQPSFFVPIRKKSAFLMRTVVPIPFNNWPAKASGLGDITLIPYYVPDVTKSLFMGFGGALGFPTATDDSFASKKWTAGPAIIAAKAGMPFTYGMLMQQIWSYAETGDSSTISALTLQPFFTYVFGAGWAATITSETVYNWEADTDGWTVPIMLSGAKVVKIAGKPFNFSVAGVYYTTAPVGVPEAELRLNATYVFR